MIQNSVNYKILMKETIRYAVGKDFGFPEERDRVVSTILRAARTQKTAELRFDETNPDIFIDGTNPHILSKGLKAYKQKEGAHGIAAIGPTMLWNLKFRIGIDRIIHFEIPSSQIKQQVNSVVVNQHIVLVRPSGIKRLPQTIDSIIQSRMAV